MLANRKKISKYPKVEGVSWPPFGVCFFITSTRKTSMLTEPASTSMIQVLRDSIRNYVAGDPVLEFSPEASQVNDIWRVMLICGDVTLHKTYLDGFPWMHTSLQDVAFDAIRSHYVAKRQDQPVPVFFKDFIGIAHQQMWKLNRDSKRKQDSFELFCAVAPHAAFGFAARFLKNLKNNDADRSFLFQFLNLNRNIYFDKKTAEIIGHMLMDLHKKQMVPKGIDVPFGEAVRQTLPANGA